MYDECASATPEMRTGAKPPLSHAAFVIPIFLSDSMSVLLTGSSESSDRRVAQKLQTLESRTLYVVKVVRDVTHGRT